MIRSSNSIIRDLVRRHVDFARDAQGNLAFTREGAHSQPRILFHEDETGKQITQTLLDEVNTKDNIEICEYMTMVDIISKDNVCGGVIVMDEKNEVYPVRAPYVVLACGGLGGLYKNSTNFPHIAGDGLGIAMKHQVYLNIWITYRFIQPRCIQKSREDVFWYQSPFVVRVLCCWIKMVSGLRTNCKPRDTVSKAIFAQMEKEGSHCVWEDMRPLGKDTILKHFPKYLSALSG